MNTRNFSRKFVLFSVCLGLAFSMECLYNKAYGQPVQNKKAKVAYIYTVTTPELKEDMMREAQEQFGNDVEIMIYEVPWVFEEIKRTGYVTALPASKLIQTYMKAIDDGADAILSICSTVADVAFSMQEAAEYIGVPIIIVNEEMCREAVRKGQKIALMATFNTSIDPTRNILQRVSREMGKHIEVTEVLLDGAFGLDQTQFRALMAQKAGEVADKVDVIVFTQGSMAYCEKYVAEMYGKVVLSNPRFGTKAVKDALISKGLLK